MKNQVYIIYSYYHDINTFHKNSRDIKISKKILIFLIKIKNYI